MRLTLRTLLAYLDDILEPSQAKEIGAKIQESSLATSLINRIREVMRRRRITAPPITGSAADVDANTVSEYLDNTLPPEGVAEIEKTCLESDIHLAEVAASHQILTLALGEPVEISSESRERMYALGPVKGTMHEGPHSSGVKSLTTSGLKQLAGSGVRTPAPIAEQTPAAAAPVSRVPDYLRQPMWRRALPFYVAIAIILLVWLGSVIYDPAMSGLGLAAKKHAESAGAATVPVTEDQTQKPAEAETPAAETAVTSRTGGEPAEVAVAKNSSETPAVEAAATEKAASPETPADAAETPAGPAERRVATVTPVDDTPPAEPAAGAAAEKPLAEGAAAPRLNVPPMQYVSSDGVLLRYEPKDENWFRMPHRSQVHAGEVLAVPEPFEASLAFGEERHTLEILGGSVVGVLPPNAAAPYGLDVRRGRFVVRGGRGAVDQATPTIWVALSIRGELFRIELLTPGTVCGVEVAPREPTRFEEDFGPNAYTGAVCVGSGSVRVVDAAQRVQMISAGGRWDLAPEARAAALAAAEPSLAAPVGMIPDWLSDRKSSGLTNSLARVFDKQFEYDEPVEVAISELAVRDRRHGIAKLAVACLALLEDSGGMLQALRESKHQEARLEAISGLRTWVNLDPRNREILRRELQQRFYGDEPKAIYQLIWGFGDKQNPPDRNVSKRLVQWLGDDSVAIRELAFYHIYRLTGRRNEYRPDAPEHERKAAFNQWQRYLEKDGVLLAAPPKAGDPARAKTAPEEPRVEEAPKAE